MAFTNILSFLILSSLKCNLTLCKPCISIVSILQTDVTQTEVSLSLIVPRKMCIV
jgi:hypothetical protein